MASQRWYGGLWPTSATAQLPAVDLSKMMRWELLYAVEEVLFLGVGFFLTAAIAYWLQLGSLVVGFLSLTAFGFVFCRDLPNVYFKVPPLSTFARNACLCISCRFQASVRNIQIVDRCPILKRTYRYPFWAGSPHLSTLWNGIIRAAVPLTIER